MTTEKIDIEKLSEEEEKAIIRLEELQEKKDKNDEDRKEIDELKKTRNTAYQKRIDILKSQLKEKEYLYGKASAEAEELKTRVAEIEKNKEKQPEKIFTDETIEINGKKYYTDETLIRMVQEGKLDDNQAWKHQRDRDKEEAADRAYQRLKEDQIKETEKSIRQKDADWVLENYPTFDKKHPDHDPNDPLYKEATRLWNNGYNTNPRGLSEAIKDAKRILQIKDKNIDISDDFSINNSRAPIKGRNEETSKVSLSEYEKETAIRMYCRGDVINPRTGRSYTENEAIEKAKKTKENRLKK